MITQKDIEACRPLVPFLVAGRAGLARSRWRPGQDTDDLIAPIVVAVLVEVSRTLGPLLDVPPPRATGAIVDGAGQ